MPSPRAKKRRAPLLALVYGATFTLIVITVGSIVLLIGSMTESAAAAAAARTDQAAVSSFATHHLRATDFGGIGPARGAQLARDLQTLATSQGFQTVTLFDTDGAILASSAGLPQPDTGSASGPPPTEPRTRLQAQPVPLLVEDLPLTVDGQVQAVIAVERDGAPIIAVGDAARRNVLIVLGCASAILTLLLFLIFRAAQHRLTAQANELVEATRRDPLTGLPNHAALVATLSDALADARESGGWLAVAILDIDNFEAFNATYGHEAGDAALRTLGRVLSEEAPDGGIVGRFGPDEFLLAGPPGCAQEVRPAVDAVRERLRAVALQFDGSEQLPMTVSAGISSYPENAAGVTELLGAATQVLRQAKISGGDSVHVDAPPIGVSPDELRDFGVLQGLVTAIDTKDRYTKRHSEEVAHYALLIGERLGMDPEFMRALRLAGLLHDIGKIGIPDAVLRKPGSLTPAERETMQRHPAIGALMISGLPTLDLVRAGVRYHHERWDGGGYPDGVGGDAIPRIARILSVADAFSAMTTSRSYRAGLPVAEALRRLEAAAGTQLEARLVTIFTELMREQPEHVVADGNPIAARLWAIHAAVA